MYFPCPVFVFFHSSFINDVIATFVIWRVKNLRAELGRVALTICTEFMGDKFGGSTLYDA